MLPGRFQAYSPEVQVGFPAVSVGAASFALPQGELVLGNLHLAAFDPEAGLRADQLERLAEFLQAETAKGSTVVLGGDWNLVLADTRFPHTTEERFLGWIHPLPSGFPPPGYRFAVDRTTPTVRTLERPYLHGENFTGIIDGFLVSADAELLDVRTYDLAFRFSDHHPVLLRLRLP